MLPDQLRAWRRMTRSTEARGKMMSQREAAKLLGISKRYFAKLESPKNFDPIPNWVGLACSAITFQMKHFMTEDQHDLPR